MNEARRPTVAVVIPCFRQGRFLASAVESVLRQSEPATDVIVVDDGGKENLSASLSKYPGVRLVRQENRGLAAARNLGLREARSDKILFLDADDELLPDAIRAGLNCFQEHSDAAFVYGPFEEVSWNGRLSRFTRMDDRLDLIRCNWVAMIAAAMFDRAKLLGIGGFDETLAMCEDWDVYLRISRDHGFAAHDRPVAVYRRHDKGMSAKVAKLRYWIDQVRELERGRGLNEQELHAWREGERVWDSHYPPPPDISLLDRVRGKISRLMTRP